MSAKKRGLDEKHSTTPKHKKAKLSENENQSPRLLMEEGTTQFTSSLISDEIDFPRGGGTSFTPLEYKTIRAEGLKEADEMVFKDSEASKNKKKQKQSKPLDPASKGKRQTTSDKEGSTIRVEHLNYKRMAVGMKLFCQIISVQPLFLVVSLPNQLLGHVPITQITSQLTSMLEALGENESDDGSEHDAEQGSGIVSKSRIPELSELFHPGQYLRAVVTALKPVGTMDGLSFSSARDQVEKTSRRVELSTVPEQVNAGVLNADLRPGFTITASVKSAEDHGYILDLGLSSVAGFLSFKDAEKGPFEAPLKLSIGALINVVVSKISENGRTCTVEAKASLFQSTSSSEVTNVSSLLPGTLVQSLITATMPAGLNVQLLGFFAGTVDLHHLPSRDPVSDYAVGQKIKARVLYNLPGTSPPQFSLTLHNHVVALDVKSRKVSDGEKQPVQESFPIGTTLQSVKVVRVEAERGLVVEIESEVEGYVHISHASDDHVPSLSPSSGPWKVDTVHRARVTGYHPLDGLLQLSFRPSVLEQKFLQVSDVQVGEIIKGTVRKLSDTGLFVSMSGNVDGVVWPNHFADILLKQPQKRFKAGANVKCRVLAVDPDRKRIVLTAKKTLVESDLPIIFKLDQAKVGLVTHAVVCKISKKNLLVEFYNNLKATVFAREASETLTGDLSDLFTVGKPVKVRILSVDNESSRIVASIRQAALDSKATINDVSGVEVGHSVSGIVSDIHKDNAVLSLQPTQIRALISIHNLANHRGLSVAQLRDSLAVGDRLDELVVVSRNPDKGFVIVARRPNSKAEHLQKDQLTMDSAQIGEVVVGRVGRYGRRGAFVKFSGWVTGSLHPTDACDNYDDGVPFPAMDSAVKAIVIDRDVPKKYLTLSTRASRMTPETAKPIVDREITVVQDLKVGDIVRGFIKSIVEHGVFVTLGRDIDARVQIKELYDEYVKEWKTGFEVNQLVKGRIISVNAEKKQVEMSFRSKGDTKSADTLSLSDLSVGQKVEGVVKKVEAYGIFVGIQGLKLSGLCHKTEIADNKDADVTLALRSFKEGDRVKAVVLSIDFEKRRISLGLKPSYFEEEDFASSEEVDEDNVPSETLGIIERNDEMQVDDDQLIGSTVKSAEETNSEDSDSEKVMDVDEDVPSAFSSKTAPSSMQVAPAIKLQGGFQWTGQTQADDEGYLTPPSDSESEGEPITKKKRKHKKEIEHDLTADMHTRMPESTSDFERHLLGSPNSSYMWIQYMSFQLQLSEIDKAREIGKRALQAISFREEQEKLNVWIALLNLENTYGTDESLEVVFKDAARHNDSKTIHLRLAAILDQSDKTQKAEEQYKRTCKKFGQSSKVWTLFGEYYLRHGEVEQARALLPRSLQSLEKRKHLKTISKFAQMEYKLGDPERGKTIFEGIVDSHPKRWDIWSIYMDMEATQNDIQNIRNLFGRVMSLKMTSHKAKTFFKKWLDLERRIGDEDGARIVKEKATEWAQRASGTA